METTNLNFLQIYSKDKMKFNSCQGIAEIVFTYSLELLEQLNSVADKRMNFCFAPLNVLTLLTMSSSKSCLAIFSSHFHQTVRKHQAFEQLLEILVENPGFSFANLVYVHKGYTFENDYKEFLRQFYRSVSLDIDTEQDCETIRQQINEWVKNETGEIEDFVRRSINDETKIALVGAIIIRTNFYAQVYETGDFFVDGADKIQVTMMTTKLELQFAYYDKLKCKILEYPLSENNLSLFIILPRKIDGLQDLLQNLTSECLKEMMKMMNTKMVEFTLPVFNVQREGNLRNLLEKTYLFKPFFDGRDIIEITGNRSSTVTDLYYRAVLQMDGKPAGEGLNELCFVQEVFHVSHPFLFFVKENTTTCILVWGRIINPNEF